MKESGKEFEKAAKLSGRQRCVPRLYVAGSTQKSMEAIRNIRRIDLWM